jgi:urease accessory protein
VIEDMLRGLGAQLTSIEAPFDPEPGAYEASHHDRHHDHAHRHHVDDHAHAHDHEHD